MANKIQLLKDENGNNIFPIGVMADASLWGATSPKIGINPNNLIASITSFPYTATQDCWAFCRPVSATDTAGVTLDGVLLNEGYASATVYRIVPVYMQKGQVLGATGHGIGSTRIFGVK